MRKLLCVSTVLGVALVLSPSAGAAEGKSPFTPSPEAMALQARAAQFTAAFNKGDAKALAAFWTPNGDYIDQEGRHLKGRKALAEAFQKMFAVLKGAKLRIHTSALRVVKDDLAIEDGLTEVFPADGGAPTVARYTAVHVKKDGKWLLASVRDAVPTPPRHAEPLDDLAWLLGDWEDEVEKGEVAKASYSWAENENFLVCTFVTTLKDVPVAGGTQWIGWDPAAKQLRSWTFNSSGGFSGGIWTRAGNKWSIQLTATLPNGKKLTATNTITRVDDDHLTWQSTKRSLDGKAIPDTDVVKMKRAK